MDLQTLLSISERVCQHDAQHSNHRSLQQYPGGWRCSSDKMIRQLSISKKQWQEMLDHVARHVPLEACGLLAGKNDWVEEVIFVRNQAQSPDRFVMDSYEQLKAFNRIESNKLDLLGIFHSHPTGLETVSPTDIAEAAY